METKDKVYIIDENLKQSIWKDTVTFGFLFGLLCFNHNWLGSSWVTEVFTLGFFVFFVLGSTQVKKMTKKQAYDLLKKEFEAEQGK